MKRLRKIYMADMTCLGCGKGWYEGYMPPVNGVPTNKTLPCNVCGHQTTAVMTPKAFDRAVEARNVKMTREMSSRSVEQLKKALGEHFHQLAVENPKDGIDHFINERLELFAKTRTGSGWDAIQTVHKLKELAKLSHDERRLHAEVTMRSLGMTWK